MNEDQAAPFEINEIPHLRSSQRSYLMSCTLASVIAVFDAVPRPRFKDPVPRQRTARIYRFTILQKR